MLNNQYFTFLEIWIVLHIPVRLFLGFLHEEQNLLAGGQAR